MYVKRWGREWIERRRLIGTLLLRLSFCTFVRESLRHPSPLPPCPKTDPPLLWSQTETCDPKSFPNVGTTHGRGGGRLEWSITPTTYWLPSPPLDLVSPSPCPDVRPDRALRTTPGQFGTGLLYDSGVLLVFGVEGDTGRKVTGFSAEGRPRRRHRGSRWPPDRSGVSSRRETSQMKEGCRGVGRDLVPHQTSSLVEVTKDCLSLTRWCPSVGKPVIGWWS